MKEKVTRLNYCQYLLVSQINYTLTNFADHCKQFSHDAINRYLGGEKINPEKIEAVLLTFPGIVHAAAFGRENELGVQEVWAAVAGAPGLDPENIRAHCLRRFAPEAVPVRVLVMPDIPRNAAGKIDRGRLMKVIAGG